MNAGARAEIRARLEWSLRLGFDDFDTVVVNTQDLYESDDDYPGDTDVESMAEQALSALLEEQQTWARPTDAERLDAAFKMLDEQGILARHCYAPTRTWAAGDLEGEIVGARHAGRSVRGFAFYTSQDAEQLLEGSLNIAWSPAVQPGQTYAQHLGEARRVGIAIVDALAHAGLDPVWDGATGTTIRLRNVTWRHPRSAITLAPMLSTTAQYAARPSEPRSRTDAPSIQTEAGEWHVRIALLSNASDNGPLRMLRHLEWGLREGLVGHATPLDRFDPEQTYALDYAAPDAKLRGRVVRVDLVAPPTSVLFGRSRRTAADTANTVVFVPTDEQALDAMLESVPIDWRTKVIVLDTACWTDPKLVARLRAKHGEDVCLCHLETGEGVGAAHKFIGVKGVRGLSKRSARRPR